jgi:hypothetical protein
MQRTINYRIGKISWKGKELNAFVISGITKEDIDHNPFAAIFGGYILGGSSDLSGPPNKWAVFAEPHLTRPDWKLLGAGSGQHALPGFDPSDDVPQDVISQLLLIP